jgi:two-component system, OmpR family, sensor histidine kinase KdpD
MAQDADIRIATRGPRPPAVHSGFRAHALALFACAGAAAIAWPLTAYLDLANIVMMFLLTVVLVALRLGRSPSVLAAIVSVALFDFFFVPPQLSLAVSDAQYIVTFAVMLAVALITGQLTASLHASAQEAAYRERRTQVLYEMAREFAGALTQEQVLTSARRVAAELLDARIALMIANRPEDLRPLPGDDWVNIELSGMALDDRIFSDVNAAPPVAYLPLKAPTTVRGVMAVLFPGRRIDALAANEDLMETIASLIGIAVERLHYVDVAKRTELEVASERLRSSILSALSHDVRTPLTALVGLADTLSRSKPALPEQQRELAQAIREQSVRIDAMVNKLLDMARLSAGTVRLKKEWQPLQEVVGASLKLLGPALEGREINVDLPSDLPLVEFDAVMMERVLCNLIENAVKYTPAGGAIDISARAAGAYVEVQVCDRGHGIAHDGPDIFGLFQRGERESAEPGVGLGLAICRSIVEAHGGTIAARERSGGGTCFVSTLPAGTPPVVEPEENGMSAP